MAKKDIRPRYRFPETGRNAQDVNQALREAGEKDASWKDGKTFSLVFYAGEDVSEVTRNAYEAYRNENGLNPTAFPSLRKFENEVVSLTIDLMHGDDDVVGNMTSGGTESILCAVKAAHSWAKTNKPQITAPEMVVPISVHPAFDKAAYYFGIKMVHVPVNPIDLRADVKAMEAAINSNTILVVGSAPAYPHGVVDPIEELAAIAIKNNLWLHVDACVGGYMLPWVERLGYMVPKFDFRVAGVSSMSMDLHKYGYSAKGGSCVLYKNSELRKHQYFVYTGWTGGIYASPSVAGTRPGGAIAAAWAVLNYLGAEGYLRLAKDVMDATMKVRRAVENIDDIYIIGNPHLSVLAIGSDKLPVFNVGDELSAKGYHIDRQQDPDSLHLTISWGNVKAIDQFIVDLAEAVAKVRKFNMHKLSTQFTVGLVKTAGKILNDEQMSKFTNFLAKMGGGDGPPKRSAAMYGMMGALPNKGDLDELILDMLDGLNKPEKVQ